PKVQIHSFRKSRQCLRIVRFVPADLPVAVPDASVVETDTGDPGTGAILTLEVEEAAGVEIGHRQMREVDIVDAPRRLIFRGFTSLLGSLAEEHQLEAVAMTIPSADVSGVIPPLGAELRVVEVIARKLVVITREGDPIVQQDGDQEQRRGQLSGYCTQLGA